MPAADSVIIRTAADGALRVRRGCFSDGWEESIWELLFLISPGRELWSGGHTPDWAAKEAGGLPPYVAQVCRFEGRSTQPEVGAELYTRASDH